LGYDVAVGRDGLTGRPRSVTTNSHGVVFDLVDDVDLSRMSGCHKSERWMIYLVGCTEEQLADEGISQAGRTTRQRTDLLSADARVAYDLECTITGGGVVRLTCLSEGSGWESEGEEGSGGSRRP
jgi:hypothetical protein